MTHEHTCHGPDGHEHKHGLLSMLRGHSHEYDPETKEDKRRLLICMFANGVYGLLQLVVGFFLLGSMILATDAVHNISDMVPLGIPLLVIKLRGRHRTAPAVLTWVNYCLLIVLLVLAAAESLRRIAVPENATGMLTTKVAIPVVGDVNTGIVMACMAGIGICVNSYSALTLRKGKDLNMRAAFKHQLADLIESIAAVAASIAIAATSRYAIDPVLTVFVSVVLTWMVWPDFMRSGHEMIESVCGREKKEEHAH